MKRCIVALSFALAACGGTVEGGPTTTSGHGGASSSGGSGTGGSAAGSASGSGGFAGATDTDGGDVPYRDPGCPPETRIDGVHECDVGSSASPCPLGERCIPYVQYGEKCNTEETGTRCVISGTGVQGDDCTTSECADGFVCVSGGSGFECEQLCTVSGGRSDCPPGLLCSPLDVDGYSVCG